MFKIKADIRVSTDKTGAQEVLKNIRKVLSRTEWGGALYITEQTQ